MMYRTTLALVAFASAAAPASAATFNTLLKVNGNTCASESISSGTTSVCDGQVITSTSIPAITDYSVTARAELGSIGVAGRMESTGDTTDNFSATASIFDTLFFGIDTGTITLSVDLAGNRDWSLPAFDSSFGPGFANNNTVVGLSMSADLRTGPNNSTLTSIYTETLSFSPAFQIGPTVTTTGSLGTTALSFDFTDGKYDIAAVLGMTLACRSGLSDGACSASVDFLNSLRFTGASVFDADGNAVSTTISSSSGFDYATGLPSHGAETDPSVVPVPASALLLSAGLGLLAALRRRRWPT